MKLGFEKFCAQKCIMKRLISAVFQICNFDLSIFGHVYILLIWLAIAKLTNYSVEMCLIVNNSADSRNSLINLHTQI